MSEAPAVAIFCAHTELVDIDKLVENPRNPNTHPESQIALLAKIIRAQGFRNAIVVSKRSGFVTKGHGLSSTGNVAAGTELQNVNFTSKADFRGVLYVDDFAISNTIMIPESGSLSLIGAAFASIAIILHIRRRR